MGGGHVSLTNGVAYGEPYESAVAELTVQGKDIEASNVVLKVHGMQIAGNGGYDWGSEHLHAHVEGHDILLSKFVTVQKAKTDLDGVVSVVADANGTMTQPGLKANLKLTGVTYQGQGIGEAVVEAHSDGDDGVLHGELDAGGCEGGCDGAGGVDGRLSDAGEGDDCGARYRQAAGDVWAGNVKAQSLIDGVATVSGPLKTPKELSGEAEFSQVDVKLQGIELKAAEPLRVGLRDGVATLEQVHITGQDTDMRASGTAQLFGVTDPKGGKLDVKATGSVSMTLLHTFDSDIHFEREDGVHGGGGRAGDESGADGQGAVRQGEHRDGWGAERVEQYERDAGVQR